MSALLAIAARCEQAAGPDRELDARIWCHLKGYRFIKMAKAGDTWGEIEGTDRQNTLMRGWMVFEHPNPGRQTGGQYQQYSCEHGDAYTASLDAAMTLVPEGLESVSLFIFADRTEATVLVSAPVKFTGIGGAQVHTSHSGRGRAATPALALCTAALRARAAQ